MISGANHSPGESKCWTDPINKVKHHFENNVHMVSSVNWFHELFFFLPIREIHFNQESDDDYNEEINDVLFHEKKFQCEKIIRSLRASMMLFAFSIACSQVVKN